MTKNNYVSIKETYFPWFHTDVAIKAELASSLTLPYIRKLAEKLREADGEDELGARYFLIKKISDEIKFTPYPNPEGPWIEVS